MTETVPQAQRGSREHDGVQQPTLANPVAEAGRRLADRAYRRRRLLWAIAVALMVVVVFAGAAVGYSLALQPKIYGATIEFVVTPRPDISDAAADRAMVTQVMILQSDPVLQPVADQAGVPLGTLRGAVSAEMVGRSSILRLTVADPSQSRAVVLADLIGRRYLEVIATPAAVPGPGAEDQAPPTTSKVLSVAAPLNGPLQPRPVRALAAGTILGLLAAGVVVIVMLRPRFLTRPPPDWK